MVSGHAHVVTDAAGWSSVAYSLTCGQLRLEIGKAASLTHWVQSPKSMATRTCCSWCSRRPQRKKRRRRKWQSYCQHLQREAATIRTQISSTKLRLLDKAKAYQALKNAVDEQTEAKELLKTREEDLECAQPWTRHEKTSRPERSSNRRVPPWILSSCPCSECPPLLALVSSSHTDELSTFLVSQHAVGVDGAQDMESRRGPEQRRDSSLQALPRSTHRERGTGTR